MQRQYLMTFRTRVRLLLPVLAVASVVSFGSAQQPAATIDLRNAPLGQTIPVDPLITVGTLPNGLRYYVRENRLPQARAELRLVVKAGSVLEDEDQRGLAHFVEHMAFNGTLHFPKQEITSFMQSLGMRFGAHVNANTGFDQTIYELQIPSGNRGGHGSVAHHPRRLRAQRVVRRGRDRQRARRHSRGVAAGARSRRADTGRADARAAEGFALRRTVSHREAGDHPQRELRSAEAVLRRLVSPRHDGGRRRRRLRQVGGRSADQIALRADPRRRVCEAEARLRRAGPTRNGLLDHYRPRSDANGHQCLHQDARSRPIDGRRLPTG